MNNENTFPAGGEFLLYQTEDGKTRIEVRLQGETIWLTLNQMAELFQVDKSGISRHLKNIYATAELQAEATVANFATVQHEGSRHVQRQVEHYNLDAIISVDYRVNSLRGTQFRIWATQRLREYIVKGFTMDDQRLKQAGKGNYFDELLARIRDIRSSEKVFWRKVLDIYATSIDYDPSTEVSRQFFAAIQNKMHWAAHGQTAAEVIFERANAASPNMGLTAWAGGTPRKGDNEVAKNYLNEQELDILNRIVTSYLEFAELHALSRKPMYMSDWIAKHFEVRPGGATYLDDAGRKEVIMAYQKRKQDEFHHPVLDQKVPFGLLPHVQSRLLARHLRGDLEQYTPVLYS